MYVDQTMAIVSALVAAAAGLALFIKKIGWQRISRL